MPLKVGNTAKLADVIAEETGGEVVAINPAAAYPDDYRACTDQAAKELKEDCRPALKQPIPDMTDTDVLFIGYPIWWGEMPMPVKTFLETADLAGKTVIPFCTHEGSGIGATVGTVKHLAPKARVTSGLAVTGSAAADGGEALRRRVRTFLASL